MTDQRNRALVRLALITCACAAGSALAACSGNDDSAPVPATPGPETVSITMPGPDRTDVPNPDQITPEAAKQLCDMTRADLDTWRDQGTTIAKVSFNGTVHNWAIRNGGLNDLIVTDRTVIDTATTQNCPDVRQQALEALDVPDLASALAGVGR
ncbi:hypothetical protein OHA40_33540 [Nocardia sp. NBC_00508]|uniref:hypothetical protein n=1 Tax=Nocardia sp. NBC_00508 TaxID=2975992 RepID=UPI002E7FCFD2|nr:hypothetical protein [Nocardia sp. NBC_00508]WUD66409.1 hypothetical protein OHA40_33540 [Nocardia sp. NBC_00508]